MAALQSGQIVDAERKFKALLQKHPRHIAALNLLSVALTQLGKFEEAEQYVRRALKENATSDATFYNYELILKALNRPAEALESFNQALVINPTAADTWNNRGVVFNGMDRYREAIADFDKAIAINPRFAGAHCNKGKALVALKMWDHSLRAFDRALELDRNLIEACVGRGNVFASLKRHDDANAAYDKALALKPDFAEAWLGRGNLLAKTDQSDEAMVAYDRALALKPTLAEAWLGQGDVFAKNRQYDKASAAYDKALAIKPNFAEVWLSRGNLLSNLNEYDEAAVAYDRALALKPDFAEAWHGRGCLFFENNEIDKASAAYDKALMLRSDFANAWIGKAAVFSKRMLYKDALAAFDKALAIKPDFAGAWIGRGTVCSGLKQFDEAFSSFDKALTLEPDLAAAEGARLHAKMHLCDWSNFDAECAHLLSSVEKGTVTQPFVLIPIASSADEQLQCAKLFNKAKYPSSYDPIWRGGRYNHDRIRVAYLSADFRDHPVSYLLAGVFEHHDRERFETVGISFGPTNGGGWMERIKAALETFIDVRVLSDAQIVDVMREKEIDIAIDLMGYTQDSRPNVMAMRPAPIQINYLGYPGTMGADFMDYIIADQTVIPVAHRHHYAEKIAYMPDTFQSNDRAYHTVDKVITRAAAGLPPAGFVFCCFNASYKITPAVFDLWMRILRQTDGAVLWLYVDNPTAKDNLRRQAATRGVTPDRLIFAPGMALPEHQARLPLADLFLDTSPFNAGATASGALWAGVPILTRMGDTFAGRMGASLLNAIGLLELIATSAKSYEALAIELASQPEKLATIKRKLSENRLTTPLFDTGRFTKQIEAAYIKMHERNQAGLPPDHLYI